MPAQNGPNPVPKMDAKAKKLIGSPRLCDDQMSIKDNNKRYQALCYS